MVKFSIIIPNYNGISYLLPCIDSIRAQKYQNHEIIIVDNASADSSTEFIRDFYPDVHLIVNSCNRGFAGGCNDGANVAKGEFLFFLNVDTRLRPEFLASMHNAIQKYGGYGMYAPKMKYPDGRINSTGICISLSGAAWDRGLGAEDSGRYDQSEDILGPSGGAALFRREAFFEAGGFDEDFFLYMEDLDLVIRAQLAGWKCRYIPEAVVYHHHGGITGIESDISVYYGNRNLLWYPVKNYPWWLLLLVLPWTVGRTIGVVGYYALKGKGRVAIKAKWDGICYIPQIIKKRKGQISKTSGTGIWRHLHVIAFSN
ncbi:MAG: glycosyltransferase family 2 protein [Methanospirillum sp.]|uniref:glycosyltransferase family 2 protein n=1 Tax=Methanospirillum sp. TaxID=45200 RepID=UPI002373B2CA|nr:glycosyltransferase family 2 protein [Methanospirillum sp.]MDD1730326.1 glycosyltransferase family 2 protein [Methanospirillum sp.]